MNIMLRCGGPGSSTRRACHLEHHGDARGVVVGARVEHAAADAQMVEMGRHDHPLVAQLRVRARATCAPTFRPWTVPGSLPGIGCMNSPSNNGASSSPRNWSIRYETVFSPPAPLRPPNSGDASAPRPCAAGPARVAGGFLGVAGRATQPTTATITARPGAIRAVSAGADRVRSQPSLPAAAFRESVRLS